MMAKATEEHGHPKDEEQVDDDAADDLRLQEVLQAQPESGHADEELGKVPERSIDQSSRTLSEVAGE
jgi:hypothetical protein